MLGDAYTLEYLPLFDEELAEAARYITCELRNPDAAMKLVADAEAAIQDRLFAPESFEPVPSMKEREHPYYRIGIATVTIPQEAQSHGCP